MGLKLKVKYFDKEIEKIKYAETACGFCGASADFACCFHEERFRLLYRNFMNPSGRCLNSALLNGCQCIV